MTDCFWTDFVGCVEDCASAVLPTGNAAIQQWPGSNVTSDTQFEVRLGTDVCTVTQNGGMGESVSDATAATIVRAELTFVDMETDASGCGSSVGAAPDWWPADAPCGAWHWDAPGDVLSGDNLHIAMTLDDGDFYAAWGDLLAALGFDVGTDTVHPCVVNMEIVGNDGIAYYGSMVMSYCF